MKNIPLNKPKQPVVPETWIKLHHVVVLFILSLIGTLIFNGI
ncbi:hypothetical protein FOPPYZMZ_CDS0313 [Pseudomonas phage 9Ps-7B]|nr:hypothetical protein [Pseudomonas phage T2P]QYV99287.1 hypothetical protein [Pseudomonas phage U1B]QYV99743.1 hypothetical protein [Pseudomonas phage U5]UXD83106.1 hypothetical protein NP274_00054 [Pseudomonas phage Koomba boorn-mokiny kep-wari Wadjak 1]WRQ05748.1 hypothetical protein IPCDMZAV_CDS0225 [Pseudomonas phage 6B]WRQ06245.1 hypothetical protein QAMIJHJT_CDS0314 [Pseudomonas phage 9-Ps-8B]WRQ06653.1 hypothetical protein FOPPYZMZ_CDS0313 [Pseudomonas phage 9Ps-7B]WRQ07004.1 hypoth